MREQRIDLANKSVLMQRVELSKKNWDELHTFQRPEDIYYI